MVRDKANITAAGTTLLQELSTSLSALQSDTMHLDSFVVLSERIPVVEPFRPLALFLPPPQPLRKSEREKDFERERE